MKEPGPADSGCAFYLPVQACSLNHDCQDARIVMISKYRAGSESALFVINAAWVVIF
jgi:hypothetical protein